MTGEIVTALTFAAALGCALVAGVFFAFSSFVMGALARLPAEQGIAAMQAINVVVINRSFLGAFFGTGLACLALAAASAAAWTGVAGPWILAGSLLYLAGTIGVTIACNVPRNDALARVRPGQADAAESWRRYLAGWTRWNHVRAAAALLAAAALVAALSGVAPIAG